MSPDSHMKKGQQTYKNDTNRKTELFWIESKKNKSKINRTKWKIRHSNKTTRNNHTKTKNRQTEAKKERCKTAMKLLENQTLGNYQKDRQRK